MKARRCRYPECPHTTAKNVGCKLHLLPADPSRCRVWMRLCKFAGTPRRMPARVQICSCHFEGLQGPTKQHPNPLPYEPPASLSDPFKMKTFQPNVVSPVQKNASPLASHGNFSTDPDSPFPIPTPPSKSFKPSAASHPSSKPTPESAKVINDIATTPNLPSQEKIECAFTPSKSFLVATNSFDEAFRGDSFDQAFSTLRDSFEKSCQEITSEEPVYKINRKRTGVRKQSSATKVVPALKETKDMDVQADFPLFSYERSKSWSDKDFHYFTGISKESFEILFELCEGDHPENLKHRRDRGTPHHVTSKNTTKNKLFLTLVRLRRGFSLTDMRMMFGITESIVSDIFTTWVRFLAIKFKSMEEAIFVSAQAQEKNRPDCYESFPNLRCVFDTTDIKVQKPHNLEQQSNTYSSYKSANVHKFLVCTSLYGGLSFISEGAEGNISDRQLFLKSGVMQHLCPGDAVMCDRGFDVEADLNEIGVDLLVPPFLGARECFTAREVLLGKAIASSRIHVETFIGRMKFFKLIRHSMPNTMIDVVSDVVRVCANLINFNNPFIRWDSVKQKSKKRRW